MSDFVHTRAWIRLVALLALGAMVLAACGGDTQDVAEEDPPAPDPADEPDADEPEADEPEADEPESDDDTGAPEGVLTGDARCEANREAGTITFLTGFGFFPSVSVADVIAADANGYFDEMCLDVDIQPSIPGESLVLVSANAVQFAANSFGTIARGQVQGADVEAVINYGHVTIRNIVVLADSGITELEDFRGTTIGSGGGSMGPELEAMLRTAGLVSGEDYFQAAVGFDPRVITSDDVDGIAGFRSNQVNRLRMLGHDVREFFPEDYGIQGSFGAIIMSREFGRLHPTAAEDFVRAAKRGWEWAIENDEEVVQISDDLTEGDYDPEHEMFRWTTEKGLALEHAPEGQPMGWVDSNHVAREIAHLVTTDILEGRLPDVLALFNNEYIEAVHDGTELIWPGPIGD